MTEHRSPVRAFLFREVRRDEVIHEAVFLLEEGQLRAIHGHRLASNRKAIEAALDLRGEKLSVRDNGVDAISGWELTPEIQRLNAVLRSYGVSEMEELRGATPLVFQIDNDGVETVGPVEASEVLLRLIEIGVKAGYHPVLSVGDDFIIQIHVLSDTIRTLITSLVTAAATSGETMILTRSLIFIRLGRRL